MGRVVAIVNQKGGVGKTTTAINLGAALGALEKRVLLVDCDPQGNATRGVGQDADEPNLYHALTGECPAADAIRPTSFPNLDLLASNRDLVGVEVEFVHLEGRETKLRDLLGQLDGRYDTILVDCPPSLGQLTVNALSAADEVLVPLQCEYYALEGISELMDTVSRVRGAINPRLAINGILLTMYDDRTNLSKDVAEEARNFFETKVYRTIVPRNIRLAEAPSYGMPIIKYDIGCRGAKAYLAVAQEFLQRAA